VVRARLGCTSVCPGRGETFFCMKNNLKNKSEGTFLNYFAWLR
jgi:hypothetical protein